MTVVRNILAARAGRRVYIACTAAFFVLVAIGMQLFPPTWIVLALPPIWMLIVAAPRLRDIGWNPWWATTMYAAYFLSALINVSMKAPPESQLRQGLETIAGLITLGFFVLLAVKGPGRARASARG